ncbi:Na/Pi cotransporter family protein [uncultured Amaricoccus sp.]|uniref:Na/Pi cotransporter family protein n=1 Tax=uncultured Amaricoccus sp. TaxID=339341 RepID=UPI00262994F2|nr:Na/Pi cotransporter family protein [uncultured Amaricoccus sp.]
MPGHVILLNLFGGVALLLWGTHMVQGAVLRGFGAEVRAAIGRVAGRPAGAALTGAVTAATLQSATATAVLLIGFLRRGMIALPAALAMMLGADFGTTLVVQALSFDLKALIPAFLVVGVVLAKATGAPRAQQVARALIGLGLMLLALGLVVSASAPLRDSGLTLQLLDRLRTDPILAVVVAALLAWLMHSSVAFVLFVISLSGGGLIDARLALLLTLGANLGGCLVPFGLALDAPRAARRVLWGNLAFRACGVLLVLALAGPATALMARLTDDPARQVANFHSLFNLGLALVCLPFTPWAAHLLTRAIPDDAPETRPTRLAHLDDALLDRPALALNAATRELMRLSDIVELMLREALSTFTDRDDRRVREIARMEEEVDALQEEIKLYLARLMQGELDAPRSAQVLELVLFTTNLEHIGDIIDNGLLRMAVKKQRKALSFSPEGWRDLQDFHAVIAEQMRLALTVFVTRDCGMARRLVAQKDALRQLEIEATERHIARLRDGLPETIETSALHLDVLRDLKRINAHLTTVAYPILEPAGALRGSRLRATKTAEPQAVKGAGRPADA